LSQVKTKVAWSFEARVDFEAVLLARRERSLGSAKELRETLLRAVDRLRDYPDLGRDITVAGPPGAYRRLVSGVYLIDYRHIEDTVIVLQIRDGRTDEPSQD
jgi:plasmid stabilization system protein ParE